MAENLTDPYARKAAAVQTYTQRTEPSEMNRVAQAVQSSVMGQAPEMPALRGDINSKIAEMYAYDQKIAPRYAPGGEFALDNPSAAWGAESERMGQLSGQVGDLFERLGRYQDLYGNVVERALSFYDKSLTHLSKQVDFAQQDIDNDLNLKKLAQSGTQKQDDTLSEEQDIFQKLMSDSTTGEDFENQFRALIPQLGKRGINVQNIWDMYDSYMQDKSGYGKGVSNRRGVIINPKNLTNEEVAAGVLSTDDEQTAARKVEAFRRKNSATSSGLEGYYGSDSPEAGASAKYTIEAVE